MIRKHFSRLKTWRGRVNFAIKNGLTKEEHSLICSMQGWRCCAIGEARETLEKKGVHFIGTMPYRYSNTISAKAFRLGCVFSDSIGRENYKKALRTLTAIENLK